MQFLIPMLVGALAQAMVSMAGRVALAFGIGFVTYKGIGSGLDVIKANVIQSVSGLPVQMVNLIGYLWIDKGLTLIFSAFAVALSMRLVAGSLKKMVVK